MEDTELIIAAVSFPLKLGDKEFNLNRMEEIIASENINRSIDLFIFPENNVIGGFFRGSQQFEFYRDAAESLPNGFSCRKIMEMAEKYNTTICSGLIEKDRNDYYITHFLCGPSGFMGLQRKLFPQNPEKHSFFMSGERLNKFEISGHKAVILACADFMFPETTILAGMDDDVSLIVCPTDAMQIGNASDMRKLVSAKSIYAKAVTVTVFGHDNSGTSLLSCIAVDQNGNELLYRERMTEESRTDILSVKLVTPKKIWGGNKVRSKVLFSHLGKYFSEAGDEL